MEIEVQSLKQEAEDLRRDKADADDRISSLNSRLNASESELDTLRMSSKSNQASSDESSAAFTIEKQKLLTTQQKLSEEIANIKVQLSVTAKQYDEEHQKRILLEKELAESIKVSSPINAIDDKKSSPSGLRKRKSLFSLSDRMNSKSIAVTNTTQQSSIDTFSPVSYAMDVWFYTSI